MVQTVFGEVCGRSAMREGSQGLRTESSMFSYRNGLIDQMYRTGEVMKTVADPAVARALAQWHSHLGSVLSKSFETTAAPPNVDTGASNQDKATALWNILNLVTSDLDAPDAQDNTKRFMMYIAWHEGQGLTYRVQQPNGPALSFFQIQGASAQTAYNSHSMTDDLLTKLASLTGSSHDSLQAGFEALTGSASFPAGNLIGTLLGSDIPGADIFGAYVARVLLKTFPDPLPQPAIPPVALFQPQADYWFKFWHGNQGDADSL